jgi:ribosomal protein S12 methylthiotransferase
VHYATKQRRLKEISLLQTRIYHQKNKEFIGKTVTAVCDGYDEEKALYYGRTYREAPQIDKRVYFGGEKIKEGESYEVLINSCDEYDIYGVALKPVKGEWINNEFAK